jgi:hypothetical protein
MSGTWKLDVAQSHVGDEKVQAETLQIHQDGDSVTITESLVAPDGKEKRTDIQCNTLGKDCKLKEGVFSVYYNGSVLVVMQTHGDDLAVKRRLTMAPDGSKITMDVIHILPPNKPAETYTFVKQ